MIKVMHAVSIMNRAGQETFIMNMYRNIDRSEIQFGFQCSVSGIGDFDEEIKVLGGEIYHLEENRCRIPFLKYINDIRIQYRFFKEHKDYEVYHIHTYHAFNAWLSIVGAKLAGIEKVVLHSHNTFGMHPQLHKIFRYFLKYMKIERLACSEMAAEWMYGKKELKKVKIINNGIEHPQLHKIFRYFLKYMKIERLACSEMAAEWMYGKKELKKVKIINNGIDAEAFVFQQKKREDKRRELGIDKKLVIGHIGRFMPQKNHKFLIEIFEEIVKKDNRGILLLIGVGELQQEIEKLVEEKGLTDKVRFMGVRTDIKELLWAMDLFLFPSLYEGLSVVAIEAQAAGVPVLASDTLTEETKVTECMQFYSLEKSTEEWAEQAIKMTKEEHKNTVESIKNAHYDMKENIGIMEKIYLK